MSKNKMRDIKKENKLLWDFFNTHNEIEVGLVDFNLHNKTVEKLEKLKKKLIILKTKLSQ